MAVKVAINALENQGVKISSIDEKVIYTTLYGWKNGKRCAYRIYRKDNRLEVIE